MTADLIVEALDVIKHICTGQVTRFIDPFSISFLLQATEEAFDHCVIPAVAWPAHAGFKVVGITETFPVIATVLAALV